MVMLGTVPWHQRSIMKGGYTARRRGSVGQNNHTQAQSVLQNGGGGFLLDHHPTPTPTPPPTHSGELRTQKLMSHLVRTQSLNVLPLKPGVGQYTAIHATFTARVFFLAYFYPSSPFTCSFYKTSPDFSWVGWVGSCVGLQNKIGHPARCRFPC